MKKRDDGKDVADLVKERRPGKAKFFVRLWKQRIGRKRGRRGKGGVKK